MALHRGRNLALVLVNLPFALVGGVFAAWIGGGTLSIGSLVGFVTLFGITTRNALMMVTHFEHLVREEGCPWGLETALRGASERLAPIVMTALVTALGLLPLALGSGRAGGEIEGPMATVILGGLVTSGGLEPARASPARVAVREVRHGDRGRVKRGPSRAVSRSSRYPSSFGEASIMFPQRSS
jgi:Cu/Ag efflux pump CusA